jgi:RNA polymerase sigma factor (TIGR02999 family)
MLVHHACLQLVGDAQIDWKDRGHFMAFAARSMRRALIDDYRRHQARKGGIAHVALDTGIAISGQSSTDLIDLDTALKRLVEVDPLKEEIVEKRYIGGMEVSQAARL